jgi:hypothetical protein
MKSERRTIALNRALFTNRPLDSAAVTALVTLLHRFTEAGDYELFVSRDGQLAARSSIQVVGELPEPPRGEPGSAARPKSRSSGAPNQINLDLATIGEAADELHAATGSTVATGGIMGFYVSGGTGRYTVTITRIVGDKKETVLDSAKGVPEGDFFAVTFVRPGLYSVVNRLADAKASVRVDLPKPGDYRPGRATLVQAVRGGFEPGELSLFSGQSLLFQCQTPSQIVVELVEPAPGTSGLYSTGEGGRARHTVRRQHPPENQ